MNLNGWPGRLGRSNHRLRSEIERDAEDIGVLDVEETALLVQVVRLAAERSADDLLAEKLRPEGADAEDVSDGASVPAFAQHGDGKRRSESAHRGGPLTPTVLTTSRRRASSDS